MKKHPHWVSFDDELKELLKDPAYKARHEEGLFQLDTAYRLMLLRKKRRMSQRELAKKIGTSQSAVARMETGNMNMTIETISRVATALGVRPMISFV